MTNQKTKGLLALSIFLIFLFSISTYAVRPLSQVSISNSNMLSIEYPKLEFIKANTPFKLHFHIMNSTGKLLNSSGLNPTFCLFHLYNNLNNHLEEINLSMDSNGVDYEYINTGLPSGKYPLFLNCENNDLGGFYSDYLEVTATGKEINQNIQFYIIGGLIIIIWLFLFIIHYFKMDYKVTFTYGIIAGTLCILAGYWLMGYWGFVTDTLFKISILGLCLALSIYFFTISNAIKKDNQEDHD